MKTILVLLMMMTLSSYGQNKHVIGPKKAKNHFEVEYRDTSWTEVIEDTTLGTMNYHAGAGIVTGPGCIIKYESWSYIGHMPKYPNRQAPENSSFTNMNGWLPMINGTRHTTYTTPYILTNKGYKRVDEEFTFSPYIRKAADK